MKGSRRFTKRISVHSYTAVSDGAGGNTTSESLTATVWAELKTMSTKQLIDIGYTDATLAVKVTVRKPNTFDYKTPNMAIKYNSVAYTIVSATVNPDYNNRYITFTAVKKGG